MDLALVFWVAWFSNDINVLQRSHLFGRLASGDALACNYTVNGDEYNMGYYLANGIYPKWAIFLKTILFMENRLKLSLQRHKRQPRKIPRELSVFWKLDLQ
jgi:hypothetical protein